MPDRSKHTKARSVRVPDERWEASQAKAEAEGRTVSDVVNEALQRYITRAPRK